MQLRCSRLLIVIAILASFPAWGQGSSQNGSDSSTVSSPGHVKVVPKNTIIVKGAWNSASDSTTPTPEGGTVVNNIFNDAYFGITYSLPAHWTQKYTGPPPSDTGFYVLAQIVPTDDYQEKLNGHFEIFAQDMFFAPFAAKDALQMISSSADHLLPGFQVERKPTEVKIGGQPAGFFSYWAPVAGLHWYVMATEIRCHTVKIVMTSRDTKLLEDLMQDLNKIRLPAEASPTGGAGGGPFPVCIKDYAASDNLIERVDPVFPMRRYNSVPVRIIVDKEGKVKHAHILRAFPEQEKAIYDALKQWKFKPYEQNGQHVEVETGVMFGRPVVPMAPKARETAASK